MRGAIGGVDERKGAGLDGPGRRYVLTRCPGVQLCLNMVVAPMGGHQTSLPYWQELIPLFFFRFPSPDYPISGRTYIFHNLFKIVERGSCMADTVQCFILWLDWPLSEGILGQATRTAARFKLSQSVFFPLRPGWRGWEGSSASRPHSFQNKHPHIYTGRVFLNSESGWSTHKVHLC